MGSLGEGRTNQSEPVDKVAWGKETRGASNVGRKPLRNGGEKQGGRRVGVVF